MNNIDVLKTCSRCVMDTTAEDIVFDEKGVCNYCSDFIQNFELVKKTCSNLDELVNNIKRAGRNKEYDCVIGISGGLDSSYLLHLANEWGLRPLATHMDNGWDTELASHNISNLVNKLDVDLYTHVIDWNEYKQLMHAFLKAQVIDIELLYDNALIGVNYGQARKYNIKYLLTGTNYATEGIPLPKSWRWKKIDGKNIKSINKKYGNKKIKSFPIYTLWNFLEDEFIHRIKKIMPLNYVDYRKEEVLKILKEKYDYKPYPYKHYESVFTRFYQGYILPEKWGIDKRKLHLSNLIMTNQISREEALDDLTSIPYNTLEELEEDKEYVCKKLDISHKQLDDYISSPGKSHDEYGSDIRLYNDLVKLYYYFFGRDK